MKNGKLKKKFVKNSTSKKFQKQAYPNIFVKNRFQRKMYRVINRSKVSDNKTYKYSGLAFLIFPELIAQLAQTDYETYLQEQFYKPLGTAEDLAKIMHLYQTYGTYKGKQLLSEQTMKEFTKIQFPENENRRGLGFDKPLIGNDTLSLKNAYPSPLTSPSSFGHSGFTGTFAWTDPENQMVYIFLSNRVYTTRAHRN